MKKKEKEPEKRTGDLGRRCQYPFLCVCRGIVGEKEQNRQKKQMDGGKVGWRGERRAWQRTADKGRGRRRGRGLQDAAQR